MKHANDRRTRGGDTREEKRGELLHRKSSLPLLPLPWYYGRFGLFRKRTPGVKRDRGTVQFSTRRDATRRKTRSLRLFVTAAADVTVAFVEPAIYRNRKIANKGSLALCNVVSFLRYIKGAEPDRRGCRGVVDGLVLAFSRDAKFISAEMRGIGACFFFF